MRKLFLVLVASAGLTGFAAAAQADCNNMAKPLETAKTDGAVVATGTPVTPVATRSGG